MWKSIALTTLIAGSMDITAACTQAYLSANVMPERLLKYVASGVFGKAAFSGGFDMMVWGLFFHFIIAFACVVCFFWAYPKLPFLEKSVLLNSFLIGVVAWTVTTRLIVPMSQVPQSPFQLSKAIIAASILVVCIGFPIAYNVRKFFNINSK
jgi:hypothetical protein